MTISLSHATGRILGLRESTGPRVALRRGTSVATEQYAYPYLVPLWADDPWARVPLLRAGSLAAIATHVTDDPDVSLGRYLRRLALADLDPGASYDAQERELERVGRRVVWAQTGDVEKLHHMLRQLVPADRLARPAVSWRDVIATYLWWDQPNADKRRRHRRRLLEAFYTPTVTAAPADGDQTPTAAAAAK